MKILIAEDNKNSMMIMEKFLSHFGNCDKAIDGVEAFAAIKNAYEMEHPYDLLVLDIMMPNLNGIDALKKIRLYEKTNGISKDEMVKVVIVSALSGDDVKVEVYTEGCVAYLRKPIDLKLFERIIYDEFKLEFQQIVHNEK